MDVTIAAGRLRHHYGLFKAARRFPRENEHVPGSQGICHAIGGLLVPIRYDTVSVGRKAAGDNGKTASCESITRKAPFSAVRAVQKERYLFLESSILQ